MSNKYATLLESLNQPLPPGFDTISGELPQTLMNDLMFRIVFESNPDGLKKLLCALLHLKEYEITDITINNPILLGEQVNEKKFILDLNISLNNEKIIHLELQVVSQSYWTNRSLCYLCENFRQLNSGDNYDNLKPLIQIDLLDFELYKNSKEFYAVYHLANDKTHRIYSDKLAIHVLELNKGEYATDEDKAYGIDYWARLFKSTTWEELKALAMEQHNLQSTVEVIYRVNADEQARDAIIDRERFLRDQRTQQDIKKRLEAQLAEQTGIIAEQSNTIAEQSSTITEQNNTITEQNNTITEQNNTIAEQSNTITEQGNIITEQSNTITEQGNTIAEQTNTITEQSNTIAKQTNHIDELKAKIAEYEAKLASINEQNS